MNPRTTRSNIAWFKERANSVLPVRPGPKNLQRLCNKCFSNIDAPNQLEPADLVLRETKSFENLLVWAPHKCRKSNYQSVQYHPEQLSRIRGLEGPLMFVVGLGRLADLEHLAATLDQCSIDLPPVTSDADAIELSVSSGASVCALVLLSTLAVGEQTEEDSALGSLDLSLLLDRLLDQKLRLTLVPIIVTKDFKDDDAIRAGSVCIQMLDPWPLQNFRPMTRETSLTLHLLHDLNQNAIVLPTHLVAFLLLNIPKSEVTLEDLVEHTEWLMRNTLKFDLPIGFTGQPRDVVEFALLLLENLVVYSRAKKTYRVKDSLLLAEISQIVARHFAHQGMISAAILKMHNVRNRSQLNEFSTELVIRLPLDDFKKLCLDWCSSSDASLRRSCDTLQEALDSAMFDMEKIDHFFRVEEPKFKPAKHCEWAGEWGDDDREFYDRNKDHDDFKSWFIVSGKAAKVKRLNLFKNAADNLFGPILKL